MKTSRLVPVLVVAMGGVGACNIHDNTATVNIPNATINATTDVDVNNVMPEQQVAVSVDVKNVFLIEPSATPPPEHIADAGHIQVYIDDTTTPPVLVTAQTNFNVTIPKETKEGHHKIICRVHKHDGMPTSTTFELSITVKATVTTTTNDGSTTTTVDASVGIEVGVSTGPADASAAY